MRGGMPTNNYELFNFEDPICAAVRTLIGADAILQREETARDNIYVGVRLIAGTATDHVFKVPEGEKVYDTYAGAQLEITVSRRREDDEALPDASDTTSRDPLTQRVAQIRHQLRHAKTTRADHLPINDELTSPKITHIQPGPGLAGFDVESYADYIVLTWRLDYHIPADIWPNVILTEEGYVLQSEDGEDFEAE